MEALILDNQRLNQEIKKLKNEKADLVDRLAIISDIAEMGLSSEPEQPKPRTIHFLNNGG